MIITIVNNVSDPTISVAFANKRFVHQNYSFINPANRPVKCCWNFRKLVKQVHNWNFNSTAAYIGIAM